MGSEFPSRTLPEGGEDRGEPDPKEEAQTEPRPAARSPIVEQVDEQAQHEVGDTGHDQSHNHQADEEPDVAAEEIEGREPPLPVQPR